MRNQNACTLLGCYMHVVALSRAAVRYCSLWERDDGVTLLHCRWRQTTMTSEATRSLHIALV